MGSFSLDALNRDILRLIGEGKSQKEIADALNRDKDLIFHRIETLEVHNYVKKIKKGVLTELWLSPQGVSAIFNRTSKVPVVRLHAFELRFSLLDPLNPLDPVRIALDSGLKYKEHKLNNTNEAQIADTTFSPYTARLTTKSLILRNPQVIVPITMSIEALIDRELGLIMPEALKYAQKLGLRLHRLDKDTLIAEVLQSHIALKDHSVAEWMNENEQKLEIRDRETGEVRVVIDRSFGFDEYEAVSRHYAIPDAEKLRELTEAVIYGEFDYRQNNELIRNLLVRESKFEANIDTHIGAIKDLGTGVQGLVAQVVELNKVVKELKEEKQKPNIFNRIKKILGI